MGSKHLSHQNKTASGYIREYNRQIQSGEIIVGQKIKQLYARLVADLDNPQCEWKFDEKKALHPITFIETYCKHSKGKFAGAPFILELWEKAIIAAAFGFVDVDGIRRFRELVLMVARKNGKSELGSALGLYMQIADGESGAEVYSAATKKDQAKIIWLESKKMVKKSPVLSKYCRCLVGQNEIICDLTDSTFKPLSSDSSTLDGLNIHCALIDELHAIEDKNLYDVLVDGMSAREQPMTIITTTAGTVIDGIFDMKYDECANVLNGTLKNDRLLPVIYELDNRDEWHNREMWAKANPGLGTIKNEGMLAEKVEQAAHDARKVKNLLIKDFNVRDTANDAWLTLEQIDNRATFDRELLRGAYACGGVDLSATTDLTCATLLVKLPEREELLCEQMYWIPQELIDRRERDDRIPYTLWQEQGWVRTCEGNRIRDDDVRDWYIEITQKYNLLLYSLGYDRWSAQHFVEDIKAEFGANVPEEVRQGAQTFSVPMKVLGAELEAKHINYNNNPVLKWCLTNTRIEIDNNDNIRPVKGKMQRKRIDGLVSLLDAFVVYLRHRDEYADIF